MFRKSQITATAKDISWQIALIKRAFPLLVTCLCFTTVEAKDIISASGDPVDLKNEWAFNDGHILLNSYSFNAKKRSSFTINGVSEQINRGLTVIHFQSADTFEFKTFDTYGSEDSAAEFVQTLKALKDGKGTYLILAHDSASKSLQKFTKEIESLGFATLSKLVNRQAYT
ncbi:MAG: interleukin-like EMT inducer domain-containing protein, partial [Bacteroidota bacterium]